MKKILLALLCIVCTNYLSVAQNNYPDTGAVGIGTSTPTATAQMHIYRNTSSKNPILRLEDDNASGYTQMSFYGTGVLYHLGVGNASALATYANKFFIVDGAAGRPRLLIDSSGTVQIGTPLLNPAGGGKLSIYPTAADVSGLQFLRMTNASPAVTGNGKVLSLDAEGNVILVNDGGSSTAGWSPTGNSGTTAGTNFLGTTDNQDLVFKTDSVERFRLTAGGNFLFGTSTDNGKKFQVVGNSHFNGSVGIGSVNTSDANYKLFVESGIRTRKIKVDMNTWPDYVFESKYELMSLQEVGQYIQEHKHLPDVPSASDISKNGLELGEGQALLLRKIEELTLYVIEQNKQIDQLKREVETLKKR